MSGPKAWVVGFEWFRGQGCNDASLHLDLDGDHEAIADILTDLSARGLVSSENIPAEAPAEGMAIGPLIRELKELRAAIEEIAGYANATAAVFKRMATKRQARAARRRKSGR